MLQASKLTLWRGTRCLFSNLSFEVAQGTALIIRGPNGAGKTSLLRVLCGLTRAEEGQVLWRGQSAGRALRGDVAYAGHQPALKADLTVRQNLEFYADIAPPRVDWRGLVELLQLKRCLHLEVRQLSAGQKRRAGLARILMSPAPLWLLDEPFTNMDREGRSLIEDRIGSHLSTGGLAVVVAHDDVRLAEGLSRELHMNAAFPC
jgi:heme exporter protein A